jgi:hypothetical protein
MGCGRPGSVGCLPNRVPPRNHFPQVCAQQPCFTPQPRCAPQPCYSQGPRFLGPPVYNNPQPYISNAGYNYGNNYGNYGCAPSYGNYGCYNPYIDLAKTGLKYQFLGNLIGAVPSFIDIICGCIRGGHEDGHGRGYDNGRTAGTQQQQPPTNNASTDAGNNSTSSNADSTTSGPGSPPPLPPADDKAKANTTAPGTTPPAKTAPAKFDWAQAFANPNSFTWPTLS